jgi:hypothetical protein
VGDKPQDARPSTSNDIDEMVVKATVSIQIHSSQEVLVVHGTHVETGIDNPALEPEIEETTHL